MLEQFNTFSEGNRINPVFKIVRSTKPMYNFESESNSSEDTSEASDISWIESFCAERGHEWFCEVDRDFITNPADLAGITLKNGPLVKALSGILDIEQTEDTAETDSDQLLLSMEELYSLLHARYICTPKGLAQMVCSSFLSYSQFVC